MPYGHSPSSRYRWRADREPAVDDELHRRLGLVRRHRGPRRRSA